MTSGLLAATLGALAGVGLIVLEETMHLRPATFVAVGLAALVTIVVVVGGMDARKRPAPRRWNRR